MSGSCTCRISQAIRFRETSSSESFVLGSKSILYWEMGDSLRKARSQVEGSLSLPPEYRRRLFCSSGRARMY